MIVCVCVCLQDDTAAGFWVIVGADLVLVAVDVVDVTVAFPLVVHLGDGDQLDCLPLKDRDGNVTGILSTFCEFHFFLRERYSDGYQSNVCALSMKLELGRC